MAPTRDEVTTVVASTRARHGLYTEVIREDLSLGLTCLCGWPCTSSEQLTDHAFDAVIDAVMELLGGPADESLVYTLMDYRQPQGRLVGVYGTPVQAVVAAAGEAWTRLQRHVVPRLEDWDVDVPAGHLKFTRPRPGGRRWRFQNVTAGVNYSIEERRLGTAT